MKGKLGTPVVFAAVSIFFILGVCGAGLGGDGDGQKNIWPKPTWYWNAEHETIFCDNGIWRVRPTKTGIIWFDFYHPRKKRWFVNKNNLNLVTLVPGSRWQNSELDHVQPKVEVISEAPDKLVMRYHFVFPNGVKIYTDLSMYRGRPSITFELHKEAGSAPLTGFQWHVTFGQAEAVNRLQFDGRDIMASRLSRPFPGGPLKVQHVKWFKNIGDLNFLFSGKETKRPDPANPWWMTRVLGLKQHVTWGRPMREGDFFAFEARNVPWQPDWQTPETIPWIEGLWLIRNPTFLEGDELTFGIDNLDHYLPR